MKPARDQLVTSSTQISTPTVAKKIKLLPTIHGGSCIQFNAHAVAL